MATYRIYVQAGAYAGHSDSFDIVTPATLAQIQDALEADEWLTLEDSDGDKCLVRTALVWRLQEPNFIFEEE